MCGIHNNKFQNPMHVTGHNSILTFLQALFDGILSVATDLTSDKKSTR